MKCIECDDKAEFIRVTQFAGRHPYCEKHAKLEDDFGQSDPSYYFWRDVNPNE